MEEESWLQIENERYQQREFLRQEQAHEAKSEDFGIPVHCCFQGSFLLVCKEEINAWDSPDFIKKALSLPVYVCLSV